MAFLQNKKQGEFEQFWFPKEDLNLHDLRFEDIEHTALGRQIKKQLNTAETKIKFFTKTLSIAGDGEKNVASNPDAAKRVMEKIHQEKVKAIVAEQLRDEFDNK